MAEASSDPEVMTAQWDLSTAFLHAKIDHTVYMEQPELPEGHSLDEKSTANHVSFAEIHLRTEAELATVP